MSDSNKVNENYSVAADALIANVLQQEPASFLNDKVDSIKKTSLKPQKPLKMKEINDVDDKLANAPNAENAPLYDNSDENITNTGGTTTANNGSDNASINTSASSLNANSTYFGNRSNQNINGVKKSFEKRYNSISFSPNVNIHSSILNSSPILKPKKTLHVTNFTMNKCALRNLLLSFSGFKTVAFYQDYCFVVFADIESATAAAEQLLAKTKLKVNFSKADYIPNVVSQSSIGNPNSILHVTNYPTSTTETEMIEMYSSYPGYLHIHFSKNFSLVYYQDIASAKNVLQHMNQTTNFTTIYSIKNANNSPINMNNNYHNNVPNGPPPFNPMMNNAYRSMSVNGGLVMANGYPPPVSATVPTTSNFNANGVINHPHNNNGQNSINVSSNTGPNSSFIKYNNSNSNLAGMVNTSNTNMNNYGPNGGNSNNSNTIFGFNNNSGGNMNSNGIVNPPVKMNSMPPNINNMSYFGGMSKPMNLSSNYAKNQNNMTRKHSTGTDLSNKLLHLNMTCTTGGSNDKEEDNNISDIIKSSISQSKSETNLSGLLNRKESTPLMTSLEPNIINNGNSNSGVTSPFFKKSSLYEDLNGLKSTNSNQLLSASNFGIERNEFLSSRKFSNASSILMENNGQNSTIGMVNSMYDNNTNYSSNNKFMIPPDVSFTHEYGKNTGFNSILPLQNYGNYPEGQQPPPMPNKENNLTVGNGSKVNMSDKISKDLFNQMNYSSINDPDTLFNNLNRTLSDSALNQNKLFEDESDVGNTSMNLSATTEKLHSSVGLHQGNSTSSFNMTNPANNEKLPFVSLTMSKHGSILPGGNNSESIRTSIKQNSLSSVDLMGMTNLYNGPINSNSFQNPLLNSTLSSTRSNSSSPYIDLNHNNNLLSASGIGNTSFSSINGLPSILNKSRSFCAINSLTNDSNKNPNDLSFTSIFSSTDKKDNNSSLDGGITVMNNRYGVESPKSIYESGLKNLKINDISYDDNIEKCKSVGVIGESALKSNDKTNGDNDNFDNDFNLKVNNAFSAKDISSSYSDSSINENDFIEFIANKRSESKKENVKLDKNTKINSNDTLEVEGKELNNNNTSQKSSLSSVTSPTIIYSPTYNEKSELSIDEVIFNNNKVSSSSSSSTTQINSKINNLSYSTLINPSSNESIFNSTKDISSDENTLQNDTKTLQEDTKTNEDLIKQLYVKIDQLQKENEELSKANNYHLFLISKLENQLEMSRTENNSLKEQLNRL
ncbi:hypothetical protein BCR36DRAFT_321915 [Piromyces finnis]|uniref:RRM domain-containing protein n=1 Tax=Piromyces finnis TaxID=1754191 RepID=A0A1Y1VFZ3_9FUNG|nr:hypothetical protein BCR36DRAFT_321915 [Piromyces finnis]|eukprot:ORX54692.1 hypothetical protein BCR36DRAFT_321915 [Piromyces finnis]